jgi:hypothetical protein
MVNHRPFGPLPWSDVTTVANPQSLPSWVEAERAGDQDSERQLIKWHLLRHPDALGLLLPEPFLHDQVGSGCSASATMR